MRKLLIAVLAALVLVGCVPGVAGYAWAIGWLPIYGAVCHFDKVFGSTVDPDGYRIFMLNRGCDVDAAIRKILAAASDLSVDPARILAVYHGTARAETADEFLATDLVQKSLREYAESEPSANNCTPDGECAIAEPSSDDLIGKLSRAYASYVRSQFLYTTKDGADYLAAMLRMGLAVQGMMFAGYLAAVLFLGKSAVDFVKNARRTSPSSKDRHNAVIPNKIPK